MGLEGDVAVEEAEVDQVGQKFVPEVLVFVMMGPMLVIEGLTELERIGWHEVSVQEEWGNQEDVGIPLQIADIKIYILIHKACIHVTAAKC